MRAAKEIHRHWFVDFANTSEAKVIAAAHVKAEENFEDDADWRERFTASLIVKEFEGIG